MKKLSTIVFVLLSLVGFGQEKSKPRHNNVANMDISENITGLCDTSMIYLLSVNFGDQKEARATKTETEIQEALRLKFEDVKGLVYRGQFRVVINCKGEAQFKTRGAIKNKAMDDEVIAYFKSLGNWKPGLFEGKPVDSAIIYIIRIKEGKVKILNLK